MVLSQIITVPLISTTIINNSYHVELAIHVICNYLATNFHPVLSLFRLSLHQTINLKHNYNWYLRFINIAITNYKISKKFERYFRKYFLRNYCIPALSNIFSPSFASWLNSPLNSAIPLSISFFKASFFSVSKHNST